MVDLPTLSERARRILELRWRDLIGSCRLTGDHVARYAKADEATRRLALSRPPEVKGNIDWWLIQHNKARKECGIDWSERLASSWFDDLAGQYWKAWSPASECEVFSAWLEALKKRVQEDVASAWKGADPWYQAVCKPAVEAAISRRAGEFDGRARNAELLALIRGEIDARPREPAPPAEVSPSRARRGRPRETPNQHPEVEPYLDTVSKAATRPITIQDFCLVSGFADDTIFGFWRSGNTERSTSVHARRFEATLKLSPQQFLAQLSAKSQQA
jgi:hypothetical protein